MKDGAADPFEDASSTESATEQQDDTETTMSETEAESESKSTSTQSQRLPYIYARDKVKDERPEIHQLFVHAETDEKAEAAQDEFEERFDDTVYRLDAREAIYLAGLQNLDDAEDIMRDWGYGWD